MAQKDWDAVAAAIQARLTELDMTQSELAARAGVAPETVRELRLNLHPRRRSPRTLGALSEALSWPTDHLSTVATRGSAAVDGAAISDAELGAITDELSSIATRLNEIASRLAKRGG
ncbi:MAG TPA: helix-turn-helix transcriptional regulator [Amycolatopsis sp.]|nr:helix-turn-helix transcriptional regulator [Amycolatopsis sp.]